eukprot:14260198-Alexandrium_andersonii.AAC.1
MWAFSASSLAAASPRQEASAETFPRAPPLARDGGGASHWSIDEARVAHAGEIVPAADAREAWGRN